MNKKIEQLIHDIKENEHQLAGKTVTAGFDGFIDNIVKVIKNKTNDGNIYFENINEFGAYITQKSGAGFSLESEGIHTKIGGNMPIMSNAMGMLGVKVNCIGALSHPQFASLSSNCKLYSFTGPGTATAYEFSDGKMMIAQMDVLNNFGWQQIKDVIGVHTILHLFAEADAACMLNWSEIDASTDIWKGILQDIMPLCKNLGKMPLIFIDLSDFSKRSGDSVKEMIDMLKQFSRFTKIILSLNKNEAKMMAAVLHLENSSEDIAVQGKKILTALGVAYLLLHSSQEATLFAGENLYQEKSFFIVNPFISTGAGDNFNAGFLAAWLLQLQPPQCLLFANAVAALYMLTGKSPGIHGLAAALQGQQIQLNN